MNRFDIIETIGKEHFVSNIENDEFSYPKALSSEGKTIDPSLIFSNKKTKHSFLDIRFVSNGVSILVETKDNFDKWNTNETQTQVQSYVNYEKVLTGNKIIAILANTQDDRIKVWWGSDLTIDESHQIKNQYELRSFDEYADIYQGKKNDRDQVLKSTYALNELLHKHGINEKIRSQFVGTCLLALKNTLVYEGLSTKQIISGVEEVITQLLNSDLDKAFKLGILKNKVLESQDVRSLNKEAFQEVVRYIEKNILPYINDKSTMGQDILNLFFTTFNKYVGKADKNQAFTPDHIVHFMCQAMGINRNSRILDPCCGSGAFLVRAMTEAMDDCSNDTERDEIKKQSIYGIEYEETAFGLATTNMLIHGDGNSNIRQGNCFDMSAFIGDANINVVLMNPPYNAQRKHCDISYVKNWSKTVKQDPSKGLHYVHHVASAVKTGKLAVLLPMACGIGDKGDIRAFKEKMLKDHSLNAVFSLPPDVFHPGATASVCCMIFDLGQRHEKSNLETFFGYFRDDGFIKKKYLGRVEKTKGDSTEGVWPDIESKWLSLYRQRKSVAGVSVTKTVTAHDEWLAEAYMDTDYSNLTKSDFLEAVHDYVAYLFGKKILDNPSNKASNTKIFELKHEEWIEVRIGKIFNALRGTSSADLDVSEDRTDYYKIPHLRPSKSYNIINGYLSEESAEGRLFPKGSLIMGNTGEGSHTHSYIAHEDFVPNNNLSVLVPVAHNMNIFHRLFLIPIIEYNRYRYAYGRIPSNNRFLQSTIKLPAKQNGELDWEFMEEYIKSLPYSCNLD